MSYHVLVTPPVRAQILALGLSNEAVVEVFERVREVGTMPSALRPSRVRFGGMVYPVRFVDRANRFVEHVFQFRVYFSVDETTVAVASMTYSRHHGYP